MAEAAGRHKQPERAFYVQEHRAGRLHAPAAKVAWYEHKLPSSRLDESEEVLRAGPVAGEQRRNAGCGMIAIDHDEQLKSLNNLCQQL